MMEERGRSGWKIVAGSWMSFSNVVSAHQYGVRPTLMRTDQSTRQPVTAPLDVAGARELSRT